MIDTPGHGKLRHFALNNVVDPTNLKGIIFVVDAATLAAGSEEDVVDGGLAEAAEYLHDILLTLQKRFTSSKSSKGPSEMPVLIAANKLDLFTALPAKLVGSSLEAELSRIRASRSKGLLDSGIGMDDDGAEDRDTLGGGGEGSFKFMMMEEYNVPVEVAGGNVTGTEGPQVQKWWEWIGNHL
jgi:signal recognition particle receptor subunit beta